MLAWHQMNMQVTHGRVLSTRRAEVLRLALVAQLHAERIGKRIKQRREALKAEDPKWTQAYVADEVNALTDRDTKYTGSDVSRWEGGRHRPADATLDALAEVLGVEATYFHAAERSEEKRATPDLMERMNGERSQLDRLEEHAERQTKLLEDIRDLLKAGQGTSEQDSSPGEGGGEHETFPETDALGSEPEVPPGSGRAADQS